MPIIQQSEPASRPKTRTRSIQVFPSDEIADFQGCTAEEIGLLMQLRWHAWYHGGIENTEENLFRLRKSFGVSAQKFRKKLEFLMRFFTEIDGFLFFTADEKRRLGAEELSAKLQEAGKKGGQNSWNARRGVPKTDVSLASATNPTQPNLPLTEATAAAEETSSVVELSKAVSDAAAQNPHRKPPNRQDTEFPKALKLIATAHNCRDVTVGFVDKLAAVARLEDPGLTDERLCEAIYAVFKGKKQESAGLFLHTVPAWLRNQKAASA
jgi:hypothetical protein